MSWNIEKGSSFSRFESSYKKILEKKKISKDKIERDFNNSFKENSSLLSKCIDPNSELNVGNNLSTGIAMGLFFTLCVLLNESTVLESRYTFLALAYLSAY